MNYSNNPHTVYNGLISGQRNMFLSSSLAVIIITFSNRYSTPLIKFLIKFFGFFIFILSIFIGLKALKDFEYYLKVNKETLPDHIPYEQWEQWKYISYIYTFIIFVIAIISMVYTCDTCK